MAALLYRLGRGAARHVWSVLAAWVALLVAASIAFMVGSTTLSDTFSIPDTPTEDVTERLQQEFPEVAGGSGTIVAATSDGEPFTSDQQDQLSELTAQAGDIDGVDSALDPFATEADREEQEAGLAEQQEMLEQDPDPDPDQVAGLDLGQRMLDLVDDIHQVSEDGSAAIISVSFTEPDLEVSQDTKDDVVAAFEDQPIDGVEVDFSADIAQETPEILGAGEAVGVLVAAVVLLVMLGSIIAAGLPIINALFGVGVAALGALSLSSVVDMASVTPILGVMLGLAVGIDYTLFILHRHRHQLKAGYEVEESIALANGTSGNAVVFAGITVFIALLALNITGIPFLGLMGSVGAVSIAIAVLVAITLTPAWLSLIGMRALSKKERRALSERHGAPPAEPEPRVMSARSAILRAAGGIIVLALIAVPAASLRINLPDGSTESHDSTEYQAQATITDKFGAGMNGPLLVVADVPAHPEEEDLGYQVDLGEQLLDQPGITGVAPVGASEDGDVLAFQVIPEAGPTSESTEQLVHDMRDLDLGEDVDISVAGQASGNIDISDKLADALPSYLAVVVGLSLLILIVVFRSILVPVIATAGFILSYYAALGGVVAIYQWGWLADVFGVESPGPVLNFLPTILVGILFGLAMDYMLFLGTGMREAYAHGAAAPTAVARGFRAGRSVVTAAAIIMIAVFGGFIFSDSSMIRPIGFALAFGVLLDAFMVRMLIVPAVMHLLGRHAWWLPRWLDRLLPNVDVEGANLERTHPHVPAAAERESAQS